MMDINEDSSNQTKAQNDEMLLSFQKDQQPNQEHCQDSDKKSVPENELETNLAKLSMDVKNCCGLHLRYINNINGSILQSILMLSPECQIKVLEKNINFLYKKGSCSYDQVKNNYLCVNPSSTPLEYPKSTNLGSNTLLEKNKLDLNMELSELNKIRNISFSSEKPKSKLPFRDLTRSSAPAVSTAIKTKDKRTGRSKTLFGPSLHSTQSKHKLEVNSETFDKDIVTKAKNDTDNQFEFTVEQEKIVSFVCSPSPPRKSISQPNAFKPLMDDSTAIDDSDKEIDGQSERTFGNGDSLSETLSNTSLKSSDRLNIFFRESLSSMKHMPEPTKLLWHPTIPNNITLTAPGQARAGFPDFVGSSNVSDLLTDCHDSDKPSIFQKEMENSFNQETTLFREVSLRNLYNMENMIKELSPSPVYVQQEITRVRESIYSAVRSKPSDSSMICDGILSALDICKSWVKLSSHFKGKEFKEALRAQGCDLSILTDFLQWQCVSRIFIDKMISTLQIVTSKKKVDANWYSSLAGANAERQVSSFAAGNSSSFYGSTSNGLSCPMSSFNKVKPEITMLKSDTNQNKHWKQRRFPLDQTKQASVSAMSTNLCKSMSSSAVGSTLICNHLKDSSYTDMFYDQGDPPIVKRSCEEQFCKFNNTIPGKKSNSVEGCLNFFPKDNSVCSYNSKVVGPSLGKSSNFNCVSNSFKEKSNVTSETNVFQLGNTNDLHFNFTSSTANFQANASNTSNNLFSTISARLCDSQLNYMTRNHYQGNVQLQCSSKINPIHCADSEMGDSCGKNSYMKPGSYNPPQKPVGFQKVINNNFPIEDIPAVGIPFLYSNSQGNPQQPKGSTLSNNATCKQSSVDGGALVQSDEKWKAALTSAESFRNNLMSCKTEDGPNLNLSDTISFKTHFLLSDQISQVSSSNEFNKLSSESEELSPKDQLNQALEISLMEAQAKTSDWLMKSFNKAVLDKEKEVSRNKNCSWIGKEIKDDCGSNTESKNKASFEEKCAKQEISHLNKVNDDDPKSDLNYNSYEFVPSDKMLKTNFLSSEVTTVENCTESTGVYNVSQRKPKKNNNRKVRSDFSITIPFDQKHSFFYKKPRSMFKRVINKQIAYKLEDILNCICTVEVSNLVEVKLSSEKEVSKLELKIRCPLYLQAMRCKLANHSYDTLDQALADFQQYFLDIKCRNKGDKQCIEVVSALEQMFVDLVEKHFGLMSYESSPRYCNPLGASSNVKPRKQKKAPRRC